jgi:hypothetical protein
MAYRFNIDPKEPREEQILRHKNFGKIMHNYQRMTHPLYRTPLYRYRKVLLIVVITLIVAWLVAEFGDELGERKKEMPLPKKEIGKEIRE